MIIQSAGMDDSGIWDCWANLKVCVERVSKLKGLRINVSGNSLITSIKTSRPAIITEFQSNGILTRNKVVKGEDPSDFEASLR